MTITLEFHPASDLFPLMDGVGLATLVNSASNQGADENLVTSEADIAELRENLREDLERLLFCPCGRVEVVFLDAKVAECCDCRRAKGWSL